MSLKLDDEWVLQGQPKDHNEASDHTVFVATMSDRWIGFECSCGYHWSRPTLKLRPKQ